MSIVVTPTVTVTALDLIKRAMRLIGVYNMGEEPSSDESADCLEALNAMLGSWANDSLLIYVESLDEIALTAGLASVTVGPSGVENTDRPIEVLGSSTVSFGDGVYGLRLLTLAEYNSIVVPTSPGIPAGIWCQMDMPDITVTLFPVPSEAMTLNLWSKKQFRSFASLTTDVALPPGYDRALAYNLAIEIAPEFQKEAQPSVMKIAAQSLRLLKRTNLTINPLPIPVAIPTYRRSDIYAG